MEKRLSIRQHPEHSVNPFLKNLIIRRKNKTYAVGQNKALVDLETGEYEAVVVNYIKYEVEKSDYVKLFIAEMVAFWNLSKKAQKVLMYIFKALKINDDMIYMDIRECCEVTKLKRIAIYYGVCELLDKGLIARSNKTNIYYINPSIFFKGDRITFIKELHRKTSQKNIKEIIELPFPENVHKT